MILGAHFLVQKPKSFKKGNLTFWLLLMYIFLKSNDKAHNIFNFY